MTLKNISPKDTLLSGAANMDQLADESRRAVLDFVSSQQLTNGGFSGRSSDADLYYTFFAVSILATIGGILDAAALVKYIDSFGDGTELDFIHLACLIRCRTMMEDVDDAFLASLLDTLELYRSGDGGYQQSSKGAARGSVYACFIAWLVYRDAGKDIPDQAGVISCLCSLKLADGSYANDISVQSGSTTATAAAIVLLSAFGLSVADATIEQLLSRADDGGGFLAGEAVPIADLLSTATALYALRTVGYDLGDRLDMHYNYVASLWNEDGGFAGNRLDSESDCEYTYYALLTLAD